MIRTDRRLRLNRWVTVLVLCFIWGNSLLPGEVSGAFSDWVKRLLLHAFQPEGPVTPGSGFLRKIAHFTEFTALGCLLCWRAGMLKKQTYVPFLWGTAAACIDECIQIFTPGRSPMVMDVLLG